jgi:hypothetical protein
LGFVSKRAVAFEMGKNVSVSFQIASDGLSRSIWAGKGIVDPGSLARGAAIGPSGADQTLGQRHVRLA